ncbi:HlyD family secretion protein [Alloprevotella sp. Lung230]|uniref:HlyD family secretion protein n=1 Tax=Alloprevotella sp. Lung230 TaxID=2766595 RepID=UPI001654DB31|nr:HlyD family efflux transporter periplasmic adaptor subunit [Alloprevotella sp. Lung230]MBC8625225.1 efflux RND transporter periplasmic adaptor subunit [Alloprevotella sp. Lung230]
MKRKAPNYIPALLLIVAVVVLSAVCGFYAFRPEKEIIQGEVEVTEYRVSSKVPGRVAKILVEEGQKVHAGDVLAVLEAPDVAAKLTQAEGAEAAAAAQSRKAQKGAREEQIQGAYELWQKAIAGRQVMEKSYARVKRLHDEGVATAQKLDEVVAQRDAAIATERAAKSQYDLAKNGAQLEDKQAAAAVVQRAEGAIREVRSYLKETVLRASLDGEVTDIFPSLGELVGTGAPVMNVALMDKMWVAFNVREDHLSQIKMNAVVDAVVPALGDKAVRLRITNIKDMGTYAAWKATKTTGQYDMKTFQVKATPIEKVEGLRPGMSVLLK